MVDSPILSRSQYLYVEQSLRLWLAILHQLPRPYHLAESDLLNGHDYRLRDTGQGLHRVQGAPTVSRFMGQVLHHLQAASAPLISPLSSLLSPLLSPPRGGSPASVKSDRRCKRQRKGM